MAPMERPDVEAPTSMMEMLCRHFFGLEAYENAVCMDAEQEAWMSKLVAWTCTVLGCDRKADERRPFRVDISHAVAAAMTAGTKMNPYECQFKLAPVVLAVNEALATLREGKEKTGEIDAKRKAVFEQGENMIHQLRAKLERGEITEDELHSKSKVVVRWQSTKDSELDLAFSELDSQLCSKVEAACDFILDAWKAIAAPGHMMPIPEQDEDVLMELEMALASSEKDNEQNSDQTQSQTDGLSPVPVIATQAGGRLEDLFIDYVKSNADWMQSSLVMTVTSKTAKELKMEEDYMMFKDLKQKYGAVTAKAIRDEKRGLQEQLDKKPDPQMLPWILAHPDLPGSEDHELVRVWESAKITSSNKNSTEATITTQMELTGQQTREILPAAMRSAASAACLPTPQGLMSRGSAEDLAAQAEEYKKLRKAGKGGFANQVKSKSKIANDKLEELAGLREQLAAKPAHMSEPLRIGYDAELELHDQALKEAVEQGLGSVVYESLRKADDLDEAPEKQQAVLEALAEKVKSYQDAASMIKKKIAEPKAKSEPKGKAKAKAKGKSKAKAAAK
ncbi:unnamed protein product [Symbiodinium sp. CCMP2592]|nr:unnamed protein product [Symbiodinium sp. CCMP2592]